jgi:thioredoxin-like negative regulator of GroEL
MLTKLIKSTFNNVISTGGTHLVLFYSSSCVACANFKPVFAEVSHKHLYLRFYIVNVNEKDGDEIATALKVRAIPTVVVFQEGREVGRHVGSIGKDAFERKMIKPYIG